MRSDTANRINAAACNVFLFMEGILPHLRRNDVVVVCQCSAAQIEAAADFVAAENAGRNRKTTILASSAISAVKSFADKLREQTS